MDTKLKSSNKKYFISTAVFLLLLFLSAGMYSLYPAIREQAKGYESNIFEKWGLLNDISISNYVLYFDTLTNKDANIKPSEIIVNNLKNNQGSLREDIDNFNNRFYNDQVNLDRDLKNLEYYAVNKDNNQVLERNQGGLKELLENNAQTSSLEALKNRCDFYIVLDYNNNGDMTIKSVYGVDKLIAVDTIKNNKRGIPYNIELKPIKNMTFVYAVPKELQYRDNISSYKLQNNISAYKRAEANFINPAILLMLIVGVLIPYRLSKELIGFNKAVRLPAEVIALICILAIVMVMDEPSYSIINHTLNGTLINAAPVITSQAAVDILTVITNLLYWVISFGIVFYTGVIFKHIVKLGVRNYLKENSLIYKFLRALWRTNRRIYNYFRNIDLRDKETRKLAMLLGINLLIISIMSAMWFFGILLAIVYTIVLFRIISKNYKEISSRYNKLFEATNKIAEGNLEVNIEEDLGLFNDLKEELQNIQRGFRKAVVEEVKSQKMKAELITNVSHDLKTPLTSIITYVDLLKDERLSEEKRREYLDTLDRKSQRLKDLIEDLFEVSKATSGNITMNIVDVDIVALMKQTLLELDDKILSAKLSVRTNYPMEKVVLPLDSQRMFRVFENLISNITKYALEGSRVYIDINDSQDKTEITFRNMAASELNFSVDEIMERFVRGDKSRNTEGSGLGLAIAKSFVELQGGKFEIVVDGDLFKVIIVFKKKH